MYRISNTVEGTDGLQKKFGLINRQSLYKKCTAQRPASDPVCWIG